jgi:hypothetical protein
MPNVSFSCHKNHIAQVIVDNNDGDDFFLRKPFRYKYLYIAHPVDILNFKCARYKQKSLIKDLRDIIAATKIIKHYVNAESLYILREEQNFSSRNIYVRSWLNLIEKLSSKKDYLRKSIQILNARVFRYRKRAPMVL